MPRHLKSRSCLTVIQRSDFFSSLQVLILSKTLAQHTLSYAESVLRLIASAISLNINLATTNFCFISKMATQSAASLKKIYEANCHCGAVRYSIKYADLDDPQTRRVNNCDCSICTKNGYLLIYPFREDITWHRGYDALKKYKCATKTKDHLFCPTCGSSLMIDFNGVQEKWGDVLAVNVSTLDALYVW